MVYDTLKVREDSRILCSEVRSLVCKPPNPLWLANAAGKVQEQGVCEPPRFSPEGWALFGLVCPARSHITAAHWRGGSWEHCYETIIMVEPHQGPGNRYDLEIQIEA